MGVSSRTVPALVPVGRYDGRPSLALDRPVTLIGSGERCRLRLHSSTVSRAHALVVREPRGVYIVDLASRTGVLVNDIPVRVTTLEDGDLVRIGRFDFRYDAAPTPGRTLPPPPPASLEVESRGQTAITDRAAVIGRRAESDLPVDRPEVSSAHAVIFEVSGRRFIRDLSSRSGTRLNGRAIRQEPLSDGDEILVGPVRMTYRCHASEQTPLMTTATGDLHGETLSGMPLSPGESGVFDLASETGSFDALGSDGFDLAVEPMPEDDVTAVIDVDDAEEIAPPQPVQQAPAEFDFAIVVDAMPDEATPDEATRAAPAVDDAATDAVTDAASDVATGVTAGDVFMGLYNASSANTSANTTAGETTGVTADATATPYPETGHAAESAATNPDPLAMEYAAHAGAPTPQTYAASEHHATEAGASASRASAAMTLTQMAAGDITPRGGGDASPTGHTPPEAASQHTRETAAEPTPYAPPVLVIDSWEDPASESREEASEPELVMSPFNRVSDRFADPDDLSFRRHVPRALLVTLAATALAAGGFFFVNYKDQTPLTPGRSEAAPTAMPSRPVEKVSGDDAPPAAAPSRLPRSAEAVKPIAPRPVTSASTMPTSAPSVNSGTGDPANIAQPGGMTPDHAGDAAELAERITSLEGQIAAQLAIVESAPTDQQIAAARQASADAETAWREAITALRLLEAQVDSATAADEAAAPDRAAREAVEIDPLLTQLRARLDDVKAQIEAGSKQTPRQHTAAREALDAATAAFQAEIDRARGAAGKPPEPDHNPAGLDVGNVDASGGEPGGGVVDVGSADAAGVDPLVASVAASAQRLEATARQLADELIARRAQQQARLAELKTRLEDRMESRRRSAVEADAEVLRLRDELSAARRRLGSARDAGNSELAQDLEGEIAILQEMVDSRTSLIGADDPGDKRAVAAVNTMIEDAIRELEADRLRVEETLSLAWKQFRENLPKPASMSEAQQKQIASLEQRLAELTRARDQYVAAEASAARERDERQAWLSNEAQDLSARIEARTAELAQLAAAAPPQSKATPEMLAAARQHESSTRDAYFAAESALRQLMGARSAGDEARRRAQDLTIRRDEAARQLASLDPDPQ